MKRILNALTEQKVIAAKDMELVKYGLHQGRYLLTNFAIILLISFAFHELKTGFLFMIFFFTLRSYTGGYHTDSIWTCYILSTLIVAGTIWSFHARVWTPTIAGIAILISSGVLAVNSPVDSKNRRLNGAEKMSLNRITKRILLIELILGMLGIMWEINYLYASIAAAMFISFLLTFWGISKNINERTQ